ncbi:MAG: WYL domain-containing protein [Lawsonibacter sp.]|mgnify:CR=1 FL=1|jgi:predicted DNA-binding transcriptional regulator YafY|uniref:helix-turn-helix transcriptional regulator n=1 Tax=Lawsonibacter sp. JLR.KK007 TaxID=3114293 RepID=UPI00216BEC7E|nr:WYL domain-containing protein [Lawsonibacter sp.]MCI8990034.1 WYL domain-containing protein [Lawsonibacter sp.]MCI9268143.1 WYL domain-containing protein [Lawsonibacter sp.]
MAKSPNQKTKLLCLYRMLLRQTDEEHPLTVLQIIEELARQDIKAERKSIYDDLEALRLFGMDIQSRKGKTSGWFVGDREFELPEVKLLMDAVQSSRFITQKKSDALIRKLEGLASVHQAGQLQRQVYVSGRIKVMNESIYYNVDKLHAAIAGQKAITFKYFDYDIQRKKVFRQDGKRYMVSPYGLIWNSENYYLVAFDHTHRELRHYRVDKMTEIVVTNLDREGREQYPNFQLAEYGQKHFGMYSGQEMKVTLRGRRDKASLVWDRFGQEVILVPDGEEHFTVTLPVVISPQFFGWLLGLNGSITLAGPKEAVSAYRRRLAATLEELP